MAFPEQFVPAYVQNILAVQQQNVELFQTAIRLGLGVVGVQIGQHVISFTYDKVKKFWKADIGPNDQYQASQWQKPDSSGSGGDRSTRRAMGFEEIELTPGNSQVQPQQQPQMEPPQPQLQPQPGKVTQQRLRIEAGQQMVPVDDYNDDHNHNHDDNHDTTHDDKVPDQNDHQADLPRFKDGKRFGCLIWNNDPYANAAGIRPQEPPDETKQLKEEIAQLKKQWQT